MWFCIPINKRFQSDFYQISTNRSPASEHFTLSVLPILMRLAIALAASDADLQHRSKWLWQPPKLFLSRVPRLEL